MRKWLAGAALVAAAAVVYIATRDADGKSEPRETAAAPERDQPNAPRARSAPPPRETGKPGDIYYVPWTLADPSPGVKKWKQEGLPGTFREMVAPDDTVNVEEKMTYKQRRLRFKLTDAAAACYDGPDAKEQIAIAYTMVVKDGVLRTEDVHVLTSDLSSNAVQECILAAVRNLATTASDIPDTRKKARTTIGLHDLYVRNRSSGD